MIYKLCYIAWGALYLLCAGLGFLPNPQGAVYWLLFALSMVFFLPPAIILFCAARSGNRRHLLAVRNISLAWLIVMLVLLALNFGSVGASAAAGTALYWFLTVLASPMICGRVWVAVIFGFGCLLSASIQQLRKK